MSLLSLISRLGHAIVSWGLGGPGDEPDDLVLPDHVVPVVATSRIVVRVTATGRPSAAVAASAREIVHVVPTSLVAVPITADHQ